MSKLRLVEQQTSSSILSELLGSEGRSRQPGQEDIAVVKHEMTNAMTRSCAVSLVWN